MYRFCFEIKAFEKATHEGKIRMLSAFLEALIAANLVYLEFAPHTPRLYEIRCAAVSRQGCLRYDFEPPGQDNWLDIPRILELGYGDCEDLSSYDVAWLRFHGESAAKPRIIHTVLPDGRTLYHIQVCRADGTIEDPSVTLGMPPPPPTMGE